MSYTRTTRRRSSLTVRLRLHLLLFTILFSTLFKSPPAPPTTNTRNLMHPLLLPNQQSTNLTRGRHHLPNQLILSPLYTFTTLTKPRIPWFRICGRRREIRRTNSTIMQPQCFTYACSRSFWQFSIPFITKRTHPLQLRLPILKRAIRPRTDFTRPRALLPLSCRPNTAIKAFIIGAMQCYV